MKLEHMKTEEYTDNFGRNRQTTLYRIGNYWVNDNTWDNCDDNRTINLAAILPTRYTPEIYTEYENGYGKPTGFKILTTSYGSLGANEFAEFLEAQHEALEVVKILTEKFVKSIDISI